MESAGMLLDSFSELLPLSLSNLQLERSRLARAVTSGEGTRTPGTTAVNLAQAGHLGKGLGVTEGHVDDAVMGEGRHGGEGGGFLSTTEGTGGDEESGQLAVETTRGPLLASLVPEGLGVVVSTSVCILRILQGLIPSIGQGNCHNGSGCRAGRHRRPQG